MTVADRLERSSYQIERFSPWYGFVERVRRLRVAAWTIRYWQAGPKFRWRLVCTIIASSAIVAPAIGFIR